MFYSGDWYKNSDKQEGILKDKLGELLRNKQALDHQQDHQTETILNREATSAGDDEQFMRENKKRLSEVNAKIAVLTNAIKQMGFKLKPTTNMANIANNSDALHDPQAASLPLSTDAIQSALQQFSSSFHAQAILSPFMDKNNAIQIVPLKLRSMITPRIQSSHFNRRKDDCISALNEQYENELQVFRTRRNLRLRYEVTNRIYHIDPDISAKERYKKTDNTPLSGNCGHYVEHIWVQTIDDALQSYIEGDILELAEGRHVVAGKYKIYGTLTVRGTASSNWKTLIENKTDSQHFIWCIGSSSRVTFENLLLRSYGSHSGIVRVSLRAQFIARKVLFHCGGLEGISLEHGSKLWLDGCVLLNSVGAGIHVNTGCKCLLTQSTILNCGEGDHELMHGQGAIVIYGTDMNYAQHLVRKTPPLRFPSMDNVPAMVLDPDTTLASMLRGRTYLYVQECKIKSNFGFGISFEVSSAFDPLAVPSIASMMDVSITVRETHFTENSFGNMGKIPAHWIEHNKEEEMTTVFNTIKRINPQLFGPLHGTDGSNKMHMDQDDEEMKEDAAQLIMPLTEQALALRARNESDEYQSNDDENVPSVIASAAHENISEARSKSEPHYLSLHSIENKLDANQNETESIKLSDKSSNLSEEIVKMRQTRRTLRLSAPAPQTILLSVSVSASASASAHDQITLITANDKKSKEEIDDDEDIDVDIDKREPFLRRSSRIKDKQQQKLQQEPITNQAKTKRARNCLKKQQIKSKKRRRSTRNKSKSYNNDANDDEDDKENEHMFVSTESPTKRRRLNDEGIEKEIRFPKQRNTQQLQLSENELENQDDDMNMTQNGKLELRRSTRKASMRATKNLSNLMKRAKRKTILSQDTISAASNKRRAKRKRRHSAHASKR